MNGYLSKVIRPLVLVSPKISEYLKKFKVSDRDEHISNTLINLPYRPWEAIRNM